MSRHSNFFRSFAWWGANLLAIGVALLFGTLNSAPGELPPASNAFSLLLASFVLSLPLMALPLLPGFLSEPKRLKRWFSVPRHNGFGYGRWIGYLFVIVIGCAMLVTVCSPAEEQITVQLASRLSLSETIIMALFLCGLTPLVEECLFRGLLLESFRPSIALPLSAMFFAFAHGGNAFFLPLFFMGWCLGLVALRAQTLLPCIALHGIYNLISLVLTMANL